MSIYKRAHLRPVTKLYNKEFVSCLKSQLLVILQDIYPQLLESAKNDGSGEFDSEEEFNSKKNESDISRNILKLCRKRVTFHKKMHLTLRECMLTRRIKDAALILPILARQPEFIMTSLWRTGFEVLWNHPNSTSVIINLLVDRLENAGGLRYTSVLEAKLEHLFYYLHRNEITLAKEYFKFPHFKKRSAKRIYPRTRILEFTYKAYAGMLEYILWTERKNRLNDFENNYVAHQSFADSKNEEYMINHSNQALRYFEKATNESGIWDIFISKQIEMLSYYERKDDALQVLENYKSKNEDNPNAHRYLYKFQKENGASTATLISVLEDFIKLVPSDYLALDLFELYVIEKYSTKTILSLLFNMLDYPCYKNDLHLWKTFSDYLVQIHSSASKSEHKAVKKCWKKRKMWWQNYHFRLNTLTRDMNMLFCKTKVATLLLGIDHPFVSTYKDCFTVDEQLIIEQLFLLHYNFKHKIYQ